MGISFFIKNLKENESLVIEKILEIGEPLSQYSLDEADEQIEEFLNEKLEEFECLLVGEEGKSARGFEISYNSETKYFGIRVYTPCSIGDWETAFEFMKKLGKYLGNDKIIDEDGEEYFSENINSYPYEEDIKYGIQALSENFESKEHRSFNVFGIYRPVAFNEKMIDEMLKSENPVKKFSEIITDIQYIDAYTATQKFYNIENEICGVYTLTESVRTILPFKPAVEFQNMEIVKNEDVKKWKLILVVINGDPNDEKSYEMVGNIDYSQFIENLPKDKYSFIDGEYIVVEPLDKEEILNKILKSA